MRLNSYEGDPGGHKRLIGWAEHLDRGILPKELRALVETRVSQINGCAFCLAMHTDEGRTAGLPQAKLDTVAAWRDDPTFTDRERAALDLAETMT
ncbi:MAG TPA: carboxymuconolactone decarboxylase family protein, partial [Microthrixaceae bacterium]|nr:carboxymuconolactone decarboxylase family protein [Microthrixaceae bacterium]